MRFLRRIAGIFGFLKDENHETNNNEEENDNEDRGEREETRPRGPMKGFSVKVPVPVERAHQGPVLAPCNLGEGGVQGLGWYVKRLRIDEDGDVADEFLDEVSPEASDNQKVFPKFEVKYSTRPAKVRKQMISMDGNIHLSVEHKGRLQWV
ncbi:uncharacterized protein LOC143876512 [Tasmannia lanceolata]|uniref:uncharacterized protein LOC143876512 n=1 Tax=Tasmannia lanceolata TaxID=3420 RepID=UPI0040634566